MNYTPLNEAYQIHHTHNDIYNKPLQYSSICIFCNSNDTSALMPLQDGGSFRRCNNKSCRKNFRASIKSSPVANYTYATCHLRGTN
jgi:hypothetical protein